VNPGEKERTVTKYSKQEMQTSNICGKIPYETRTNNLSRSISCETYAMNRGHEGTDIFYGNKNKSQFLDYLADGVMIKGTGKTNARQMPEGNNKPYQCAKGFLLWLGPNSQKLTRDEILKFSIREKKCTLACPAFRPQWKLNFRLLQQLQVLGKQVWQDSVGGRQQNIQSERHVTLSQELAPVSLHPPLIFFFSSLFKSAMVLLFNFNFLVNLLVFIFPPFGSKVI
jgi:hypothetical protein